MKKLCILFIALVASTISLTSCSKDNNGSSTEVSLVGKWNYSKEGSIINGVEVLNNHSNTAGCLKDYLEFKADNSFSDVSFSSAVTPCATSTNNGTYTRSGNQVIATTNIGGTVLSNTATILILTNTDLKVKYTDIDGNLHLETYTKL